jgi:lipoprotein-anchoring transpeptidase ErfK/SrfK
MQMEAMTVRRAARMGTATAVLFACLALCLAPGTGASPAGTSAVGIVGSGTLEWPHVAVLAKPKAGAKRVRVLRQFRGNYQPQFVLALSKLVDRKTGKTTWYRISLPGRPNGQTGWVRANAVRIKPVAKRLIIDRGARRFQFWNGSKLVRTGKVGVGKPGAETPTGLFYVQSKFVPNAPILGAFAFETSAYSKLTDWPGGGVVGVHGTPWPELLGGAVSSGCVRLHNDDVQFLRTRVPLGMPVRIIE